MRKTHCKNAPAGNRTQKLTSLHGIYSIITYKLYKNHMITVSLRELVYNGTLII